MALVVVDGQAGLTDVDFEVRDFVLDAVKRRGDLRVLLCVNKCEAFHFGDVLAEVCPALMASRCSAILEAGLGSAVSRECVTRDWYRGAAKRVGDAVLLRIRCSCVAEFGQCAIEEHFDAVISFVGRWVGNRCVGYVSGPTAGSLRW